MKLTSATCIAIAFAFLCTPTQSLEIAHKDSGGWWWSTNGGKASAHLVAAVAAASKVYHCHANAASAGIYGETKCVNVDTSAGSQDNVGVYAKNNFCMLAFAGSQQTDDWSNNARATEESYWRSSARRAHTGFTRQADEYLNHASFQPNGEIIQHLASTCSKGVAVVGHSLGGAVANLISAWAVTGQKFGYRYTYTIGAPSTTKKRLRYDDYTCFPGARFWNKDARSHDPVPGLPSTFNYIHPDIAGVKLSHGFRGKRVKSYTCNDYWTRRYPGAHWLGWIPRTEGKIVAAVAAGEGAYVKHAHTLYLQRVETWEFSKWENLRPFPGNPAPPLVPRRRRERRRRTRSWRWWR